MFTINCSLGKKFLISGRRRSVPLFRFGLFFHLRPEMTVAFMCLYEVPSTYFVNKKMNSLLECGFLKQKSQTHAHCFHAFLRTDDHAAVSTREVKPQRRHACRAEGTRTSWLTGNDPASVGVREQKARWIRGNV